MVQAEATARFIRTSAQKAGLVLDLIRGARLANQAIATLKFTRKTVARDIEKVLHRPSPRPRGAERRLRRRRRAVVRLGLLRQSGAVAEAGASGADGPCVPRLKRTTHLTVAVTEKPLKVAPVAAEGPAKGRKPRAAKTEKPGGSEVARQEADKE